VFADGPDTGRGLEPDALTRLFAPFERLDADTEIHGTGLGLTVSRSLVEAMGGTIGVESTPGVGSTFWLELAGAEPAALERGSRTRSELLAVRAYAAERRLLYVDDTSANVLLLEETLRRRRASTSARPASVGSRCGRCGSSRSTSWCSTCASRTCRATRCSRICGPTRPRGTSRW
jgi:hypothetical protein